MDLAFLNPNITIELSDLRSGKHEKFHFDGGLVEYVSEMHHNYPLALTYSMKADFI